MKKNNGNNLVSNDYYIGIDAGTNSVGYAVTDTNYNLCKFNGKAMWGVRLFEEASSSKSRRIIRTNRRRLTRRKQRLDILYLLFKNELDKVDPDFEKRLKESSLILADKTSGSKYSLFSDVNYTDKDYLKEFPTVYHLRKRLIDSTFPVDVRLVFLAIHHILKNRGHFLYEIDDALDAGNSLGQLINKLFVVVEENMGISLSVKDNEMLYKVFNDKKIGKNEKKKLICTLFESRIVGEEKDEKIKNKQIEEIVKLMLGLKANLTTLFADKEINGKLSVDSDFENNEDFESLNDENANIIFVTKEIYNAVKLEEILGSCTSVSDYMIRKYEEHHNDIKALKNFLKSINRKDIYSRIFIEQKKDLNNYSAYSGYKKSDSESSCGIVEFCDFLKKELDEYKNDIPEMFFKIQEYNFAPKLRTSDNGVIPNSLHKDELKKILDNASRYLSFLNNTDADGMTIKEKIYSLFEFKIPYYVGPLNNFSRKHWIVKKIEQEKIYPWNFENIVDLEKSAENFIIRMTGKCTYTGDDALPMESLLYREYTVLNEINSIKINGKPITPKAKNLIYNELFVKNSKKVTQKAIHDCLYKLGEIEENDKISGVDNVLTTSLSSYHKLKNIIQKVENEDLIEELIRRITLFGQDKKLLKNWIKNNINNLDDGDLRYLLKLEFKGWGSLSKKFLCDLYGTKNTETGEAISVIQAMRDESLNLMQVYYKYGFDKTVSEYIKENNNIDKSLDGILNEMYLSPMSRRSIRQTLRIIDEIVDVKKAAPKKIFIEMARGEDIEKKRTISRKERLISLYKACKKNSGELYNELVNTNESSLKQDKLFLYFSQFGQCMYSGEVIPFEELADNGKWDIDHIFPRSKIKDDSISNRVLVNAKYNRTKTNDYPIKELWRNKMSSTWKWLLDIEMIDEKKYDRLIRNYPLTKDELSSFVSRQLTVTQQATKALADLLKEIYKEAGTQIVYSKAGNVSDFRHFYGYRSENPCKEFIKCREINDYHHAKDAYLNIVVGNFYDTKFTKRFFDNIENEEYSLNPKAMFSYAVKGAWVPESLNGTMGTLLTVRKVMQKNNVLFTQMPKEESGQLFDVTIRKKGFGQVKIKKNKEINTYGGYNAATGAYFSLIEHEVKNKKIRTIENILLIDKEKYEENPEEYLIKKGFINPVVIVKRILINSVLELNGIRYIIKGRSDEQIVYNHMCQLVADVQVVEGVKKIIKYINSVEVKKPRLPYENEGITSDQNIQIFDYLHIKATQVKSYKESIGKISKILTEMRTKFISMDVYEQCIFISELLKAFKCNSEMPAFSKGRIRKSKNIIASDTAYLINQSVTGLYEIKVDLLK